MSKLKFFKFDLSSALWAILLVYFSFSSVVAYLKFSEYFFPSLLTTVLLFVLWLFSWKNAKSVNLSILSLVAVMLPLCNFFAMKLVRGFGSQLFGVNLGLLFTIDLFIALALLVTYSAELKAKIIYVWRQDRVTSVAVVLIAIATIYSTLFSANLEASFPRAVYLFVLLLFYFGVRCALDSELKVIRAIFFFSYSLSVVMMIALICIVLKKGLPLTGWDFLWVKMDVPFMVEIGKFTYGNSSHLAMLALSLSMAITPLIYSNALNRSLRNWVIFVSWLSLFTVLAMYSRVSIFLYFITFLAYFIILWKKMNKISLTIILQLSYLVLIHMANLNVTKYYNDIFHAPIDGLSLLFSRDPRNAVDQSYVDRFSAMKRGYELIEEKGIMGQGLGTYQHFDPVFTSPHNYLLMIIFELGVIGAIGFLLLLIDTIWRSVRFLCSSRLTSFSDLFALAGLGCVISYSLAALVSGIPLFFDSVLIQGYLVLGVLAVLHNFIAEPKNPPKRASALSYR